MLENYNKYIMEKNIENKKNIEESLSKGTCIDEYANKLYKELPNKVCPECGCKNIAMNNWGMFSGDRDWFYYCKECDTTFR